MLYMYTMSKDNNEYMLRSYECTQPTGRQIQSNAFDRSFDRSVDKSVQL